MPGKTNLAQLLIASRRYHALNPRDKIFALHSLLSAADKKHITLEYTKSIKDVDVQASQAILQVAGANILFSGY
jgi:hypothetical protein